MVEAKKGMVTEFMDFLMKYQSYASPDWSVTSFHLYRSTLRPEGAIHALLASYPLAQPERKE